MDNQPIIWVWRF